MPLGFALATFAVNDRTAPNGADAEVDGVIDVELGCSASTATPHPPLGAMKPSTFTQRVEPRSR